MINQDVKKIRLSRKTKYKKNKFLLLQNKGKNIKFV